VQPIGKRLLVRTVDLSATPDNLLKQMQHLADLVRAMAVKRVAA